MDYAFWIELALFVVLMGLSGFFSSSETSLFSLNSTQLEKMRTDGKPTIPSTMQEERETNPFLRADNPQVAEAVGMKGADAAAVFTELRERKNKT